MAFQNDAALVLKDNARIVFGSVSVSHVDYLVESTAQNSSPKYLSALDKSTSHNAASEGAKQWRQILPVGK
jgi:hypothetical protein